MSLELLKYDNVTKELYRIDSSDVAHKVSLAMPPELTATLPSSTPITAANATTVDIISLTLPTDTVDRDYMVHGEVQQTFPTGFNYTAYVAGISTSPTTLPTPTPDISRNGWTGASQTMATTNGSGIIIGSKRITVLANTTVTVYLPYFIYFSTGTGPTVCGTIKAQPLFF